MDEEAVQRRLAELKEEHRDLDEAISAFQEATAFDVLRVQRLKKRKLALKDEINKIEGMLLPDIIA